MAILLTIQSWYTCQDVVNRMRTRCMDQIEEILPINSQKHGLYVY